MLYHPLSEAQHEKSLFMFHTCSKHNTENLPIPSWCTQTQASDNEGRENFPLCQACESALFDCVSVVSRTENAHQRKFLMLLTADYQKQIFSCAFYSSIVV